MQFTQEMTRENKKRNLLAQQRRLESPPTSHIPNPSRPHHFLPRFIPLRTAADATTKPTKSCNHRDQAGIHPRETKQEAQDEEREKEKESRTRTQSSTEPQTPTRPADRYLSTRQMEGPPVLLPKRQ